MTHSPSASTRSLSPPVTPPKQRKRKPEPDPFLELAKTPISTPLPSPDAHSDAKDWPNNDEPLLKKIILTPLLCTSFILSLFLVNRRHRAYRLAEHPPLQNTRAWLSRWSPWQWLDPEPYQDPRDSTWQNANASSTGTGDGGVPGVDGQAEAEKHRPRERWHRRKKHRKMAKVEFTEAFDMHWQVVVALAVMWGLCIVTALWAGKKLLAAVW